MLIFIKKTLPVSIDQIGFVEREKYNGKPIRNRCGRDFLYYALNYYYPDIHNPQKGNPRDIEKERLFGLRVSSWFVWTFLSFIRVPSHFRSLGLVIEINKLKVDSFWRFLRAVLFTPLSSGDVGIKLIEKSIDDGKVAGIDIAVALWGLVDHVMFVYGYDEDNLYVLDTHFVYQIGYEKITTDGDQRFLMKLPKKVILEKWTRFNRVWVIQRL